MNRPRLLLAVLALASTACATTASRNPDLARWEQRARAVTITRDDWGIPHVHGKTDADAVFGLIYAQAEDDFHRIEVNYLNALGRLAEAEGEGEVYRDLRMKLFVDPADLAAQYRTSPEWLRKLMDAWADGLNYFLARHPEVRPQVLSRFEPWMALAFSEGSIGGDIESISLDELAAFYGQAPVPPAPPAGPTAPVTAPEPGGSNGFAIAPARTAHGAALLLINPHTSFFFRAEVQVASDEGLNAYGAVTWGQFFVYQGFNEHAGWMHTSSGVDAIDEYAETVFERDGRLHYRYAGGARPLTARRVVVPYRTARGRAEKQFTVYRTHHGPIVRAADGRWISVRLMQEPVKALMQSYGRTKATGYRAFKETMELHTNSSNNTVFADAEGNIAYFHANFVPRRDPRFDWRRPVDGSDPATEWGELYTVDESPGLLNPPNGWIQNTNNAPYSAAGPHSPREQDYPSYMDRAGQNPRGVHALRVLASGTPFTLDALIAAAFDPALPAFDDLLPRLFQDYDALPAGDPLRARLAEPIAALRGWDRRWAVASIPTAVAVFWGEELWRAAEAAGAAEEEYDFMSTRATAAERLGALAAACDRLTAGFGTWQTPWGEVNRFQRLTGDIVHPFDDARPSLPVGFTAGRWGSLAAFGAQPYKGSRKIYGTLGNSFVAVVEFGRTVRARAVTAGGASGDPRSPHFDDQARRYTRGELRDVYFYPQDLAGHVERRYHPGAGPPGGPGGPAARR